MIRAILSSVIALHGIIHLMGFSGEWKLGPNGRFFGKTIIDLSENTSKLVGVLWLLTCILLLLSTFAYYSRKEWFWIVGIAGLAISQTLIVLYWPDAKWGTIVNAILVLVILSAAGRVNFGKMVKVEVSNLVSATSGDRSRISEEEVSALPNIIQTWLRKAHVVGRDMPASIYVTQKGFLRTDVHGEWMPFDAEQVFTINPPGFVWNATIHTDKFIDIAGRDKYENGTGNMLIRAASLITIADRSGKEIDQGSLIRYMAEIIWFPHAVVSDYLDWEQIDSTHARVTMSYHDVTASGIYTFDKNGFPIAFEAERYGEFDGKFSKETWAVTATNFGDFEGVSIGNASEVTWKLKKGDFVWLKLTIVDIHYQ